VLLLEFGDDAVDRAPHQNTGRDLGTRSKINKGKESKGRHTGRWSKRTRQRRDGRAQHRADGEGRDRQTDQVFVQRFLDEKELSRVLGAVPESAGQKLEFDTAVGSEGADLLQRNVAGKL
jgi:hypothetical protein